MDWGKYFDLLVGWKKLPSYRLELRIDSIIGYYLPEIVGDIKNAKINDIIIPEFPLRGKTLYEDYKDGERSKRADFLLISNSEENPHYLVEFKTDTKSRNTGQDKYLLEAKKKGLEKLVNGIKPVSQASTSRNKYNHLIDKLKELSLLDDEFKFVGKNKDIDIIYIQPKPSEDGKENVIDFKQISDWFKRRPNTDDFEKELANALLKWSMV